LPEFVVVKLLEWRSAWFQRRFNLKREAL